MDTIEAILKHYKPLIIEKFGVSGYVVYDELLRLTSRRLWKIDEDLVVEFCNMCDDHPCADVATIDILCYAPVILSFYSKDRKCKIVLSRELGIWSIATNQIELKEQKSAIIKILKAEAAKARSNYVQSEGC